METLPHEEEYVLSRENVQVAYDMIDALVAEDREKIDELTTKLVLPLRRLKRLGKEFVIRNGLPTITAEIVDDTEWLK